MPNADIKLCHHDLQVRVQFSRREGKKKVENNNNNNNLKLNEA